ncbi:MAG: hypothetical protein RI920_1323, partial [Pseudomonadota bacterium]
TELQALMAGTPVEHLPAPVSYRGFVARSLQASSEAAQAHFHAMLGDVDTPTWPLGLSDVQVDGRDIGEHRHHLALEQAHALRAHARRLGLSPAVLCHVAWAWVVGLCSGRDDVVIGTVLSGRMSGGEADAEGLDRAMGLFINTLPWRLSWADAPSLARLLQRAQQALVGLLAHEQASLADALRCSSVPAGQALFSAVLNYRHTTADVLAPELGRPGELSLLHSEERSNYPFSLSVDDLGEGFMFSVQTRWPRSGGGEGGLDGVAPERVMDWVLHAVDSLCAQLAAEPQAPARSLNLPASELALLAGFERSQDVAIADADFEPVHLCVARLAEVHPQAIAVQDAHDAWSYAQLDARVKALAERIHAVLPALSHDRDGQAPRPIVAVLMPREAQSIVSVLATLHAGAAYLVLDASYPAARLQQMWVDARPALLLAHHDLADVHAELNAALPDEATLRTMWIAADGHVMSAPEALPVVPGWPASQATDSVHGGAQPDDLAYVVYTSGSTGRPKGVMVSHCGLWHLGQAQTHAYPAAPGDRVLQFAAQGFDAFASEWLMALVQGAALHLAPREAIMPGAPLLSLLRERGITHVTLPPVALAAMDPVDVGPLLRCLLVAGEACPPSLMQRWAAGRRFINAYGPSEGTVCSSIAVCAPVADPAMLPASLPIGRPLGRVEVRVLDAHQRRLPQGAVGEICITGPGLALGYLHQPALSAERFVLDPDAPVDMPLQRLYRTGDLGCWRADGQLAFFGRADTQVKLRGHRIETDEIAHHLMQRPGVKDAVVALRHDALGEPLLAAWLTAREGDASLPIDALRQALRQALPAPMVPAVLVQLPALPLTPNGKVDRQALRLPAPAAAKGSADAQPLSPVAARLAALWGDVLGLPADHPLGAQVSFMDLGGHSLRAVQLLGRIQAEWAIELPLQAVFSHPVLADMAVQVEARLPKCADALATDDADGQLEAAVSLASPEARLARAVDIPLARHVLHPAMPADAALPLSWAQQRMWFVDQFAQARSAYVLPLALQLRGPMGTTELRLLQNSLNALVQRHEGLRTRFPLVDGQPVQQVMPRVHIDLNPVDLTDRWGIQAPTTEAVSALLASRSDELLAPFDLAQGPLVRAHLWRLRPDTHLLCVVMHHIVADGWSMGVLTQELAQLWSGQALPALPLQYPDVALWQRSLDDSPAHMARMAEHLAWWRHELNHAPPLLALPTDRPRSAQPSHAGRHLRVRIDAATTAGLQRLAHGQGATLYMVLLGAWAMLMSRLSDQDEVVIGSPVANRPHPDLERVVGCFINTLPLRLNLPAGLSLSGLMKNVRERTLAVLDHQALPFDQLVEALAPTRSLSHSPIFQTTLTLHNTPGGALPTGPWQTEVMDWPRQGTPFDLNLSLQLQDLSGGAELVGAIEYATALFDADTIARWSDSFTTLLQALALCATSPAPLAEPMLQASWRRLPWLSEAQLSALAPNTVAHDQLAATPMRLEQHVAHWVQQRPHAPALHWAGQHWSYAQLDAQAETLADQLRAQGVGPDRIVALLLDRGPALIVSMLAVLKAGGAYLPMDPVYPASRLSYMLRDARPAVLMAMRDHGERVNELLAMDRSDGMADTQGANKEPALLWADAFAHAPATPMPDAPAQRATSLGIEPHIDDLAYLIYTSGSTGEPKGVMVSHRGLHHLAMASGPALALDTDSRVLQMASPSFDACAWEWQMALCHGACLHLAPREALMPGEPLRRTLREGRITHVLLTPSALAASELGDAADSLRTLIVGGEACAPATLAPYLRPDRRVVNAYGPTEASVCVTLHRVVPSDLNGDSLSLGQPWPHVGLHVLDADLQPVPVGVAGEVFIGGEALARGYLHRPDLTRQRFIEAAPWGTPQRLYRTGDLARWDAQGRLHYMGRNDHQVKLRGFRIELGEIEHRLLACEGVREAAVLLHRAASGDQLVAYVAMDLAKAPHVEGSASAAPSSAMSAATWATQAGAGLREQIRQRLPAHMVPASITVLPRLPQTPNGKLDRAALPAPELSAAATARTVAPPQGEAELALAAVWAELLGLTPDEVGREDRFFELGGHSLLIVRMIERLGQQGLRLGLSDVFEAGTLAELALRLRPTQGVDATAPAHRLLQALPAGSAHITPAMLPLLQLQPGDIAQILARVPGGAPQVQDLLPLTPLQEGMLFHHQVHGEQAGRTGRDPYILPMVLRVDDAATADRFLNALQTVVDRHDALRTAIQWQGLSQPVQVVWRQARVPVSPLPTELWADAEWTTKLAQAPMAMDLSQAPLLQVQTAGDHLVLHFHHMVCDHISLERLMDEVALLMGASADAQGAVAQGLPTPVAYRDFVAHAVQHRDDAAAQVHFSAHLGQIDSCSAPFSLTDTWDDGQASDQASQNVDTELADAMRRVARTAGVSPATLCHLAWALVVGRCSGRDDVVFGTVMSGRMQAAQALHGAHEVMGLFVNTLPLRVNLGNELGVHAALHTTHQSLLALMRHEQAPLALALRCSAVPAGSPLFTAMLNYRHSTPLAEAGAAWHGLRVVDSLEHSNYPVSLSVDDTGSGFVLSAEVRNPIAATAVNALMHTALQALVDALDHSEPEHDLALHTLQVLPPSQRDALLPAVPQPLPALPDEEGQAPCDVVAHELFQDQVRRRPSAAAIEAAGQILSYAELDARSDLLAAGLLQAGLAPEGIVAVALPRSPEVIVAMLAVFKAGGAYLPLDVNLPEARIQQMLSLARVAQVIADDDTLSRWQGLLPADVPRHTAQAWCDAAMLAPTRPAL